jgi:fumarate reductase subunit D
MLSALVLPAVAARLWLAPAAGLAPPLGFAEAQALVAAVPVRVALFLAIALALFHWAHRFRFTLYDGLQLAHLWGLIATVCYGGAALGTLLAAWVLWTL